ncbi:unnamed protein product [Sphagnum balticum]
MCTQATDLNDTPLLWAVRNNSLACARVLLAARAWDNDSCIQSVNSPSRRSIRCAIVDACPDMIKLLLDQCNTNVIHVFVCDAFHLALGDERCMQSLRMLLMYTGVQLNLHEWCMCVQPCQKHMIDIRDIFTKRRRYVPTVTTSVLRLLARFDTVGVPVCCDEWRQVCSVKGEHIDVLYASGARQSRSTRHRQRALTQVYCPFDTIARRRHVRRVKICRLARVAGARTHASIHEIRYRLMFTPSTTTTTFDYSRSNCSIVDSFNRRMCRR